MTRNEKAKIIEDLKVSFQDSEAIIVSDYRGLSVKKLEELRKMAKEQNVCVKVIKNTLANIALEQAGKSGMQLKDTNIFLWGDQLSVCKVAAKYEEKSDFFKLKTAFIDGEIADISKVIALSKMPSRDELIAMLLQVWNAPIQNLTIGLQALKDKKEQI